VKRTILVLLAATATSTLSPLASAQLPGFTAIKRPNIANIFHPAVGAGAAYEETDQQGRKTQPDLSIVDKEWVGAQQGYWMEISREIGPGPTKYFKILVTPDDFAFHKTVFIMPDSNQPMEMDMDAGKVNRSNVEKNLDKWHSVGTETVTVPAGTFSCEHWTKDDGKGDIWASSKISPMGLVKSVDKNETMVLVKIISDAKTHITGTPTKFDPQMMMRQRMEQMQQKP